MKSKILTELNNILKTFDKYKDNQGDLLKLKILDDINNMEPELIKALLANDKVRTYFTTDIQGVLVLDKTKLQMFFNTREFLPDSFTAFKNKIGLSSGGEYIADNRNVVLDFPYKDAYLVGGQSKEDTERKEKFYNTTLAPEYIDTLLGDKVFTRWNKYSSSGQEDLKELKDTDNLILKGNNLLVMHSLLKRYAGKVKLIYIDPPYNTGNDGFKYNDSFNHSTWLTFMKNRLEVAKELLRNDGVIFISCDDNEQAYLKVLMDNIYGEENYVGVVAVINNLKGRNDEKYFKTAHEYLVVYKKMDFRLGSLPLDDDGIDEYDKEDEWGYYKVGRTLQKTGDNSLREDRPNLYFPIYVTESGEITSKKPKEKHREILPMRGDRKGCWTWGKQKVEKEGNNLYVAENSNTIYIKQRLEISGIQRGVSLKSVMYKPSYNTGAGVGQLNNLIADVGNKMKPKSEFLIKDIIEVSTNIGDIILDYHLGSGTTAAVAHKMNRQYIGIEQMDYIEDIAVERLKKVIEGEQGGISKSVDWKGGGSFVYAELYEVTNTLVEKIKCVNTEKEIKDIENEMLKYEVYLDVNFDPEVFNIKEYKELDLEDKKQYLLDVIDKNTLYLNYSEIKDSKYKVDRQTVKLNDELYKEESI